MCTISGRFSRIQLRIYFVLLFLINMAEIIKVELDIIDVQMDDIVVKVKVEGDTSSEIANSPPEWSSTQFSKAKSQPSKQLRKKKNKEINYYNKKQMLQRLKENEFSPSILRQIMNKYEVPKVEGIAFFKQCAENAQERVANGVHCHTDALKSVHDVLEELKMTSVPYDCNYEASAVVAAIAHNMKHPISTHMFGVDLRSIYMFLANCLIGVPTKPLNKPSAQFLSHVFQTLHSDIDIENITFEEFPMDEPITCEEYSLNPFLFKCLWSFE